MAVRSKAAPPRRAIAERRRERQVDEIRADILRSAATAFARHGYQASTMQQIAAEAGYTAGSLYTYFESKDAIFETLVDTVLDEFYASFKAEPEGDTLAEKLEWLVRRQFEVAESRRDVFSFFVRCANGLESMPIRKRHPRGHPHAFAEAFAAWLKSHARRGELGKTSSEEAGLVLNGISHSFFMRWLQHEGGSLTREAPRIVAFFLNGVRGGSQ